LLDSISSSKNSIFPIFFLFNFVWTISQASFYL
jgi:hypothetical protein